MTTYQRLQAAWDAWCRDSNLDTNKKFRDAAAHASKSDLIALAGFAAGICVSLRERIRASVTPEFAPNVTAISAEKADAVKGGA